jgi:hypothetical protein
MRSRFGAVLLATFIAAVVMTFFEWWIGILLWADLSQFSTRVRQLPPMCVAVKTKNSFPRWMIEAATETLPHDAKDVFVVNGCCAETQSLNGSFIEARTVRYPRQLLRPAR